MSFLDTLTFAVAKPQEYEILIARPFRSAWGYLYWLLTLLLLIVILLSAAPAFYHARRQMEAKAPVLLSDVREQFPTGFIVTVKDGKLSTNKSGPVHFDVGWAGSALRGNDAKAPKRLLTIDPEGSVERYASYETSVLITADSVVIPRGDGLQVVSLAQAEDITIDRATFERWVDRAEGLTKWIPYVFFVVFLLIAIGGPILGALFWSTGLLIYLLPMSLVTLLIGKIFKRAMDYRASYRFGLYALTFPLLAQGIMHLLGYPLPRFSFSLIFIAVTIIIFSISKTEPQGAMA